MKSNNSEILSEKPKCISDVGIYKCRRCNLDDYDYDFERKYIKAKYLILMDFGLIMMKSAAYMKENTSVDLNHGV